MMTLNKSSNEALVIELSEQQRLEIFSNTGAYVRRGRYDSQKKVLQIMDKTCSVCLLSDDLPSVTILPDGKCNKCHEFELRQREGDFHSSHVSDIINTYRGKGKPDCVLAFSGGKDSAAALLTAVNIYRLHPLAVLVDNGFIPREVIEGSYKFCESQGVNLIVKEIDIIDFTKQSLREGSTTIPCQSCIKQVFENMAKICKENSTKLVIGGHRFPPLVFPIHAYTKSPEDDGIMCISPLLGLRISEERQLQWIKEAGWVPIEIAGNTSNCKLIGYVEEHFYKNLGYNPHIYEVSKEIRAGFYSRTKGVDKLENHHISEEHRREVEGKLNLV